MAAFWCALCFVTGLFGQNDPLPSGPPPGIVITNTPAPENKFIGSPSIVVLSSGDYLASHDWFGPGAASPVTTEIYHSSDRGATWTRIAGVPHIHFATLFTQGNDIYLLGTSVNRSPGYIAIHRSRDGGATWTTAGSATTGRLFFPPDGGAFACAPTPVLVSGGRIWKAYTETPNVGLPGITGLRAMMISAPVGVDLLAAANWTRTNSLGFNPNWLNAYRPGWQEGSAVQTPDGGVAALFRIDAFRGDSSNACALSGGAAGIPRYELAALVQISGIETSTFQPTTADGWVNLPGGAAKFSIRHDPVSGRYWSIVNKSTGTAVKCTTDFSLAPSMQRNVLSLISSSDLRTWTERCRLLRWREGETITQTDRTGFQYIDWQFDGDDIIYVSRTGWGALRAHDANYLTFHRATGFRTLTMADSGPDLVAPSAPTNLSARSASRTRIGLSWTDNSFSEDSFLIERSVNGGAFSQITSVAANQATFTDDITEGTTYAYRIRANRTSSGASSYSNVVSLPAAPSELSAQGSPGLVTLSWKDRAINESKFRIQRSFSGGAYSELAEVGANVTTYADRTFPAVGNYSYRVRASNPDGTSPFSNETLLMVSAAAPVVLISPQSLVVATGEPASFTVSSSGVPAPAVQWRRDGKPITGANAPVYTISAAGVAHVGSYDAVLTNPSGTATSAAVTLRLAQTITFTLPAEMLFPEEAWPLTATATSGLPVAFTVISGPASVGSGKLLWSAPGLTKIRASQAGDSRYAAAVPVDRSVRALTSFASWRRSHFTSTELADLTRTGSTAAYGGDGIPNLVKYALGLDPAHDGSSGLPRFSIANDQGIFTYARPIDVTDVTYAVQWTKQLGTAWSEAGVDYRLSRISGEFEHWEARREIGADGMIFMRLLLVR